MSRPLRVVVASDAIGPLDSWQAGVAIARGWAGRAQVAVVPLAESGPPLAGALAALLGGEPVITEDGWWLRAGDTLAVGLDSPASVGRAIGRPDAWSEEQHAGPDSPDAAPGAEPGWDSSASSARLGRWLARCLGTGKAPARLILDLTGLTALDGGAGLLAELGATASGDLTAGLAGLASADDLSLDGVWARLVPAPDWPPPPTPSPRDGAGQDGSGVEVIGVIPPDETDLVLLGLQGTVSRRGFAVRLDPAELLAAEAAMAGWLAGLGVADRPGTGAAGGAAAAVRALGGRVLSGTRLCAELAGLANTLSRADAVVTGCTSFHVGNRGGQVVRFVAELAVDAQRPCLVFAGDSSLSRREMRTFGVEAAHSFGPGPLPEALTAAVARVAQGWTAAAERGVD